MPQLSQAKCSALPTTHDKWVHLQHSMPQLLLWLYRVRRARQASSLAIKSNGRSAPAGRHHKTPLADQLLEEEAIENERGELASECEEAYQLV